MTSRQHALTQPPGVFGISIVTLMFVSFLLNVVPTAQSQTIETDEAMNDGSDSLPPAIVARMDEVLHAVFGSRYEEDVNPFVSRYTATFHSIHKSFVVRAGQFQYVLAYRTLKTPRGDAIEAQGKWEKAVMLVRLTFDQNDAVNGFWLERDRDGPTPKGFRRGGYVIGEPMLKLAGYEDLKRTNLDSLALHVKMTAPGGGPLSDPPRQISIWKQTIDPDARSASSGALVTFSDGTRWQSVRASVARQNRCTFDRLTPGNYRVVAGASGRFDWISKPVRVVDPRKATEFTGEYVAPVFRKVAVTLKLTDSKTDAPAQRFEPHVRYFDGRLAPSRGSTQYYNMDKIDGGWRFEKTLRSGRVIMAIYGIWCHLPNGDRAVLPRYVHEFDLPAPTTGGSEPVELVLNLMTPEMTDVESAEYWPWEVYGTVKNHMGRPLSSVRVHAHCGAGSAEVAETYSAVDGSYRLRLASTPYYDSDRIAKVTVAKAWVQATAPEMAEFTLNQQGDIGLIEEGDEPRPGSFRHHHLRSGYFVKRNEPFGPIDFVMTPAVTIEVELLNTEGHPIVGRQICFAVAAAGESRRSDKDVNGVYSIGEVPLGQRGKISVVGTTNQPSINSLPPMTFAERGTYRITAQAAAPIIVGRRNDLVIRSATAADGRDVLQKVLVGGSEGEE